MGETSGEMEVGMEIETETSQTMDMEMEIETSSYINAFLTDNKVSTETEETLNRLPLHVQRYIVTHLPIRDAVKTSILSKKFKSIWHSLPCLIFDFQKFPNIEGKDAIFEEFINRTLLQHDSSTVILFELSLRSREEPYPKINAEWIEFGLDHLVQHLVLDGMMKNQQRLPNSLFTSSSLVTLDLSMPNYILTWPSNVFLPNLDELKMFGLIFLEEDVIFDFSKTSPWLEELTIWHCTFSNVKLVYISSQVEQLVLKHCVVHTCKVKLRTPSLTYFEYNNQLASDYDFAGLSPNFNGVVIIQETEHVGQAQRALKLYTELRNASFLFTRYWFIQYLIQGEAILLKMKPILFNYLTVLKVTILASVEQYKMLIFILSRCPYLVSFEVKFISEEDNILALDEVEFNWKEMLQYKIFASLEYLEVESLCGSIGQMGLVKFLLLKAREVTSIKMVPPKTYDNLGNSTITISQESWNAVMRKVLEFKRASRARISYEYK